AERGGWMSPEEGARSVWLATAGAGAVMLRSRAVTKGSFARGWAHRSVRRRICGPAGRGRLGSGARLTQTRSHVRVWWAEYPAAIGVRDGGRTGAAIGACDCGRN